MYTYVCIYIYVYTYVYMCMYLYIYMYSFFFEIYSFCIVFGRDNRFHNLKALKATAKINMKL